MRYLRWRWVPIALVIASLTIHLLTVLSYARRPDVLAAVTVFPVWVWGALGLGLASLAYLVFRNAAALVIATLWLITLLMVSDEARVLGNFGSPTITTEPADASHIRIATLNCSYSKSLDLSLLERYRPDVIFLQEMPHPLVIEKLTRTLYGDKGTYHIEGTCCTIVNGKITGGLLNPHFRAQQVRAVLATGQKIELINVHLLKAITRMDLWNIDCWRAHKQNRITRRNELSYSLRWLEQRSSFPITPAIVAGDFNAGPHDPVHSLMVRDFDNVFSVVGRGWPNTFHTRLPLIRIDHIYASRHFTPLASSAMQVAGTDHRMVIADLQLDY